jgi:MerR family regulatory protein
MAQPAGSDELLPTGEFSRRSSLSIHQLRHYHEVGLLEPSRVDSDQCRHNQKRRPRRPRSPVEEAGFPL